MVDFMVAKALDQLGVPHDLMARWGEGAATARPSSAHEALGGHGSSSGRVG
jgi:hypothetical protein